MPPLGTLAAALDFLPQWWHEALDASAFDSTFAGWVRACGWKVAGFTWPLEGPASTSKVSPTNTASEPLSAAKLNEVVRRLRAGEPTVVVSVPSGASRVYAPATFPGHPLAVLWAELPAEQSWTDAELAYLALAARTFERSPLVAALVGPTIDAGRLQQRLADAAIIAGRMAHDFDNILTGILGFADLTLPLVPAGSQQASFVVEIAKVGQRGISFTKQLHAFNRGGDPKPTPGSVAATLGREETRLRATMHPAVIIEKDLPVNLPAVAIDAAPLQAALGHVFENAVEACPKGGTVKVDVQRADLTAHDAQRFLGNVSPGPHLVISFSDTGAGIKPEVRKRLFADPFFTTKLRHRGLGLATAYRIVAAHRGGLQIDAVPPPGTGTLVRVALPLSVSRPSITASTPPPAHPGLREDAVRSATANAATARG